MGMGLINGHRVCMSIGYKLDYCVKKALQFEYELQLLTADPDCPPRKYFDKVNKVKVGQLEAETTFWREDLSEYEYKF